MASPFIQIAGEAKWLVNNSVLGASAFENLATGHGINRCSCHSIGAIKSSVRDVLEEHADDRE